MTTSRPRVIQSGSMACAGGNDPSCAFEGPGCQRFDCDFTEDYADEEDES